MRRHVSLTLALTALWACSLDRVGRGTLDASGGGGFGGVAEVVTVGPTGGNPGGIGGAPGGRGGGGDGGAGGDGAQLCPPGEFGTGIDVDGTLRCAPIVPAALGAINDNCRLYFGWRDSCSGCPDPPDKWGHVGFEGCSNGNGTDNTCTKATLGAQDVELFGLNIDGDANLDDQFYLGIECMAIPDPVVDGPCPAGSYMAGVTPTGVECVTARGVITSYVINSCETYLGWLDGCSGCTDPPSKWGRASKTSCEDGQGSSNVCINPTLDNEDVRLFGLNTDGTVDGNDQFYTGFRCDGATASGGPPAATCQAGELVVGLEADGLLRCASPAPAAQAAIQSGCHLYFGWRNDCDGCTDPPTKWGRVSHTACEIGAGGDNVCITPTLGGTNVHLFGLNTNGSVNDNDKFYVGLACAEP